MLDVLSPKWNPLTNPPVRRPDEDEGNEGSDEEGHIFRPNLTSVGSLADAFCIFVDTDKSPIVYNPEREDADLETPITVYTDGSAIKCGTDDAAAGAGVFYGDGDVRNRSIRLPNKVGKTNQVSELVGAKSATEDVPTNRAMELVSDSRHVLDGLGGRFIRWENEGYFLISNNLVTQATIARFCARTTVTRLRWVKGHSRDPGNEGADRLARIASEKADPDIVDLIIPPELRVRGAKFAAMTQSKAYRIARMIKMQTEAYQDKLDRGPTAVSERCRVGITREQLWTSICRKELNKSAQFFLWMLLHDGYTVG